MLKFNIFTSQKKMFNQPKFVELNKLPCISSSDSILILNVCKLNYSEYKPRNPCVSEAKINNFDIFNFFFKQSLSFLFE